jgi:hypothetical protein
MGKKQDIPFTIRFETELMGWISNRAMAEGVPKARVVEQALAYYREHLDQALRETAILTSIIRGE